MRITGRTVIGISVAVFLALAVVFGPRVLLYLAAFGGLAFMTIVMASTACTALRNWQLDKLPRLRAPRWRIRSAKAS